MLRICPEVLRGILATSVERAELHESVSQQHGKLISLGTMAAGLAHELNNPAAAIRPQRRRGPRGLPRSLGEGRGARQVSPSTDEQRSFVAGLPEEVARRSETAGSLDSLERSDLEDELALWMEDRGVEEAWEVSPTLAGAGLDTAWLDGLAERVPEEALGGVLGWLAGARWRGTSCCGRSRVGRRASRSSSGRSRPTRTWTRRPPRRSTCTRG